MKFAILLQNYFPYGGLQRDAVRLARAAVKRGDQPTLVTATWQGEKPSDFPVVECLSGGRSNHSKESRFAAACSQWLVESPQDSSICFSRVPGVPFHFCGDACFLDNFRRHKNPTLALLPRYRYYLDTEKKLFGKDSLTHVFFLAEQELNTYRNCYNIAEARCTLLPPWLKPAESFSEPREQIRQSLLAEAGIPTDSTVILFVGSNYKLKRLDHIIEALPLLDSKIHLAVCGRDNPEAAAKLARSLGVDQRVHLMGPRDDIPAWMSSADILVHPSTRETAGMVLVEALTYGLPVICSKECGYANHVADAGGKVLASSSPDEISQSVQAMLSRLPEHRQQALAWGSDPARHHTADLILDMMCESIAAT